jgi:hypothetical protein
MDSLNKHAKTKFWAVGLEFVLAAVNVYDVYDDTVPRSADSLQRYHALHISDVLVAQ